MAILRPSLGLGTDVLPSWEKELKDISEGFTLVVWEDSTEGLLPNDMAEVLCQACPEDEKYVAPPEDYLVPDWGNDDNAHWAGFVHSAVAGIWESFTPFQRAVLALAAQTEADRVYDSDEDY